MARKRAYKDITGQRFNHLVALRYSHSDNGAVWVFICDCGNECVRRSSVVTQGHVKTCGCGSVATQVKGTQVNPGDNYGRLTVVKTVGNVGHNILIECVCTCGAVMQVLSSNLTSGNTKSCGCLRRAVSIEMNRTHGMSDTKAYSLWQNMMRRCYQQRNQAYKHYGGRGITVCDRWHSFENFFADMGERPRGMSLDRKNNDMGYSPENCRWATQTQQARNTRANRLLTINGETKPVAQWAEEHDMPVARLYARIKKLGWSADDLFLPKRRRKAEDDPDGT